MENKNFTFYDKKGYGIYQIYQSKYSSYVYIIFDKSSKDSCLIDADLDNADYYVSFIKKLNLKISFALDTHLHSDHISSLKYLREKSIKTVMGFSENVKGIASYLVKDGDSMSLGKQKILALHTPGHTEDSYCFYLNNELFTGDTLLINGTGRTDLKTGSADSLYNSLNNKILSLKKETIIFPSHDYNRQKFSILKNEIKNNPRLKINSKSKFITTMNNLKLSPPKHYLEAVESNSLSYRNYLCNKKKTFN